MTSEDQNEPINKAGTRDDPSMREFFAEKDRANAGYEEAMRQLPPGNHGIFIAGSIDNTPILNNEIEGDFATLVHVGGSAKDSPIAGNRQRRQSLAARVQTADPWTKAGVLIALASLIAGTALGIAQVLGR